MSSLHQYPETVGKMCNCFLPARDKDPHLSCNSCRGKECNVDNCCGNCHDRDDTMWHRVSD